MNVSDKRNRIIQIINALEGEYGQSYCTLTYTDPWQLLVAGILAAQCTDKRVNLITPKLFDKYPTVYDVAQATADDIIPLIRSAGFYNTKSASIIGSAIYIVSFYDGKVPDTIDKLVTLPGVGRKIANLVIGDAYNKPSVVIDTHAGRLLYRMGFTESKNPDIIERDVRDIIPEDKSTAFCHMLVDHGRAVCTARRAFCNKCVLYKYCERKADKDKGSAVFEIS